MAFTPGSDEEAAQAVTRLVDGTLSDAERDDLESWAAASPAVTREVAAQRRVARALGMGGPAIPDGLFDAVENHSGSVRRSGGRTRRVRRGSPVSWRPAAALGLMVAAVAAVIVIVTAGSSASPSITAAAKLASVPATAPAPSASNGRYLDVSYGGVTFPNYGRLHTVATGQLTNRVGGRPALTVFYRLADGTRLSYTVFSGQPVALPRAARLVRYDGIPLRTYRTSGGLSVVTLVRYGRTCVLAAAAPQSVLLNLAAEPVLTQHV